MRKLEHPLVGRLIPLLAMLLGTILMVALVLTMNQRSKTKDQDKEVISRVIDFEKQNKPKQEVKPKPRPKPQKAPKPPKAPLPQLSSMLSGIDMGIPEFAVEDIAGSADSLLGEIGKDTVMSESTVDVKPRVVSRAPMEYPKAALKKKQKGYVLVNLLIGEAGDVEVAKVLESDPAGVFDNVALNGVRAWRFSPAQYKGKPVKVWARQRIRFDFN
ncbi:MAG: energy transducer TonB [Thiotrichales bacterium]